MKTPRIVNAIEYIDDELISNAAGHTQKKVWLRWGAVAACFALLITAGATLLPMMFDDPSTPIPPITPGENKFVKEYVYNIDEGEFSSYIGGKVIDEEKIGNKISDVSVTAGWRNDIGEWISQEQLRGEIYSISGIESDVAVAIKFIDKGEALTTTHYYVIMNPTADLSAVEEYAIAPKASNNTHHTNTGGDTITYVTGDQGREIPE